MRGRDDVILSTDVASLSVIAKTVGMFDYYKFSRLSGFKAATAAT